MILVFLTKNVTLQVICLKHQEDRQPQLFSYLKYGHMVVYFGFNEILATYLILKHWVCSPRSQTSDDLQHLGRTQIWLLCDPSLALQFPLVKWYLIPLPFAPEGSEVWPDFDLTDFHWSFA